MTRRRHSADRHLAAVFCANARSFHAMACIERDGGKGAKAYYSAIAIELSLKAYLLHRGTTDQWNRVHLRHDLSKALKSVRRAGLKEIPEEIGELAEFLSPLYASGALSHAIASPVWPLPPRDAERAITELLTTIERIISHQERSE